MTLTSTTGLPNKQTKPHRSSGIADSRPPGYSKKKVEPIQLGSLKNLIPKHQSVITNKVGNSFPNNSFNFRDPSQLISSLSDYDQYFPIDSLAYTLCEYKVGEGFIKRYQDEIREEEQEIIRQKFPEHLNQIPVNYKRIPTLALSVDLQEKIPTPTPIKRSHKYTSFFKHPHPQMPTHMSCKKTDAVITTQPTLDSIDYRNLNSSKLHEVIVTRPPEPKCNFGLLGLVWQL